LAEAESELVSGFMTEHAAVVFVFFFLAEYGSIVLMCILTSILFLGGYLLINSSDLFNFIDFIFSNVLFIDWVFYWRSYIESIFNNPSLEGLLFGLNLGLKSSIMIFTFIWARASFPRIRFDQLMAFCWTVLLPVVFALVILVPCILYSYNILPISINLF
jgi:NADH-ubiquinone oxidoreductase chain 1